MADPKDTSSYLSVSPVKVSTTQPEEFVVHWISDDQLEMLSTSRRDGLLEALWGFLGIGAGSFIPAAVAIYESYWVNAENQVPLDFIGLLQILICISSFFVAAAIVVIWNKRGRSTRDLVQEIRGRKRAK